MRQVHISFQVPVSDDGTTCGWLGTLVEFPCEHLVKTKVYCELFDATLHVDPKGRPLRCTCCHRLEALSAKE